MIDLTMKRLVNSGFLRLYKKLLFEDGLSSRDKIKVLSVAVILVNHRNVMMRNMGYRIALSYGNKTLDYRPLYDLAVSEGLAPVASVIRPKAEDQEESFFVDFIDSYIELFREGSIVLTKQQRSLKEFFDDNSNRTVSVVAPTSYGKSELITSFIERSGPVRVVVVVPSKSLLSQTKKRIIDSKVEWVKKIITHPDMYNKNDESFVFVVTQERLSRALHENTDLTFDVAFVDEAHNLLNNDERSTLLASVLCVISSRNSAVAFKFLTPFLVDHDNLKIRHAAYDVENFKISEYIKSEKLYLSDFRKNRNSHRMYDQFTNNFIEYSAGCSDYIELIRKQSLNKNIIYFNRPKNIEQFCSEFIEGMDQVECGIVDSACREIAEYTSEHYRLVQCLRKGVIYHHGSIPDTLKSYIEDVFKRSPSVRYVVTSSTLLEGVNLPVERLFMLENKKGSRLLSPSQMKNLVGRIGRFSEVFAGGQSNRLDLLEPSIYLIGTEKYTRRADLQGFLENTMNVSRQVVDLPVNTLLSNTTVDDSNRSELNAAEERLENLEPGTIEGYDRQYAVTSVGRLLFTNNITEIKVFDFELKIQEKLDLYRSECGLISDADTIIDVIVNCFLRFTENPQLVRLMQVPAQRFYSMFLEWKVENVAFKQMVARMVAYWERLDPELNRLVFVGKWGDQKLGDSYFEYWTDIAGKSLVDKINLAIVRIKEEDDFFDYSIFKFIDVLNDAEMLDHDFYLRLKYGTTDETRIHLIREGFSRTLSDLVVRRYPSELFFDDAGDVIVREGLIGMMRDNRESQMLIFEASLNLGAQ